MLRLFRRLVSFYPRIAASTFLALSVLGSRSGFASSLLINSPLAASCASADSSTTRHYSSPASRQSSDSPMSTDSTVLQVAQFPCLSDNYGYLLHDPASGLTAAVDTPESQPIEDELKKRGWTLSHILNTHHHHASLASHIQHNRHRLVLSYFQCDTRLYIVVGHHPTGRYYTIHNGVGHGPKSRIGSSTRRSNTYRWEIYFVEKKER